MSKKLKNWEELVNDGEQYGNIKNELSPKQKIIFENIKDQKVLKLQDAYAFVKRDEVTREHGINLARLIADFELLKSIHTIIITHNYYFTYAFAALASIPLFATYTCVSAKGTYPVIGFNSLSLNRHACKEISSLQGGLVKLK